VTVLGASGVAAADPQGEAFPVVCDNGVTYQVVVAGNGQFTPAHDVASNSILVSDGLRRDHYHGDRPGGQRDHRNGSAGQQGLLAHPRATSTSCTFHVEGTEDGFSIVVDGSVTGFVTPVG
jgi:hypothetical protein